MAIKGNYSVGMRVTFRATVDELSVGGGAPRRLLTSVVDMATKRVVGKDTWIQSAADVALISSFPVGSLIEFTGTIEGYVGKFGVENLESAKLIKAATVESITKLYSIKRVVFEQKGALQGGRCSICHKVKQQLNPVMLRDGTKAGICNSPKCFAEHMHKEHNL